MDHTPSIVPVARRWLLHVASNLAQTAHVKLSTKDGLCTICRTHRSPLDLASNVVQTAHVKVSTNDELCTLRRTRHSPLVISFKSGINSTRQSVDERWIVQHPSYPSLAVGYYM